MQALRVLLQRCGLRSAVLRLQDFRESNSFPLDSAGRCCDRPRGRRSRACRSLCAVPRPCRTASKQIGDIEQKAESSRPENGPPLKRSLVKTNRCGTPTMGHLAAPLFEVSARTTSFMRRGHRAGGFSRACCATSALNSGGNGWWKWRQRLTNSPSGRERSRNARFKIENASNAEANAG